MPSPCARTCSYVERALSFSVHGMPYHMHLLELEIKDCQRMSERVLSMVSKCKVTTGAAQPSTLPCAALTTTGACGQNLKRLKLVKAFAVTDPTLTTICTGLPQLESFTITHCRKITSRCVQRIAPVAWSKLTTLGLLKCSGVSDMALAAIARNRGLTDVDFSGCRTVSDTGVLSVLRNCHGMKRLALAGCQSIGACALWMCGDAIAASDSSSAAVSMQVVTWLSLLCYLMASLRSHRQNVLKRRNPPTTATVVRGRPSWRDARTPLTAGCTKNRRLLRVERRHVRWQCRKRVGCG